MVSFIYSGAVFEQTKHAVNFRGFNPFLQGEGRKDGGDSLGQHGFPASRRADEKDVVGAGRGDFQCAFDMVLAFDIGEIQFIIGVFGKFLRRIRTDGIDRRFAVDKLHRLGKVLKPRCGFSWFQSLPPG